MTAPITGGTHIPVMLKEVLDALAPKDGGIYVDGTFGGGGYSAGILGLAGCTVLAIDRDPDAIARGQAVATDFPNRLNLIEGTFGDMAELVQDRAPEGVAGAVLDLGLSSPQIDNAERGFSFSVDGPLDMRMSQSGLSAADVIRDESEADLAKIIFELGEERYARRVAKAVCAARAKTPIERTSQLADIVTSVMPRKVPGSGAKTIHPATRTFQALRIFVNDELGELRRGLAGAEKILAEAGRLCVVSFHSLEDRVVKRFFSTRTGREANPSRHMPPASNARPPSFTDASRLVRPSASEVATNPRSRSARLRFATRTGAPAWELEEAA
jgi:16S rRNA (cytosine1402-N4)-methyltransferase